MDKDSGTETKENFHIDPIFQYDKEHIDLLDEEKPWKSNNKYFTEVKLSALAAMKILKHALAGVQEGMGETGKPNEIMGLLIGKPDGNTIVVMDSCALPIKGCETSVIANDESVTNFMIGYSESLEQTRPEKMVGWYHSHPFDVGNDSHCFLSSTDCQTQFPFQQQLDPWVAIVVDPLRSLAKGAPEFGAFRCYPINYVPPKNEAPDGSNTDEDSIASRWGSSHQRYYCLTISYFMSSLASHLVSILSRKHLWIRVMSSAAIIEDESRQRFSERVNKSIQELEMLDTQFDSGVKSRFANNILAKKVYHGAFTGPLNKSSTASCELAIEQCQGMSAQVIKHLLFNKKST